MTSFAPNSARPFDYYYGYRNFELNGKVLTPEILDPLFVVSGHQDRFKAALIARLSTAKFQLCPIFANMFSDLRNHPRQQLVRRVAAPLPLSSFKYQKKDIEPAREPRVKGVDRYKFFHAPTNLPSETLIPELELLTPLSKRNMHTPTKTIRGTVSRKIQTKYRESSAQTSPWQPSFVIAEDTEPELLKLDFLKWGSGLPCGMHEVELIERARMKRAWEARCDNLDENDFAKRRNIIAAMERDEWAFREQEIQDIQDLRLKLLENMLIELHRKTAERNGRKLSSFAARKHAEKDEKLRKLRHKTTRELRKLTLQESGVNIKYHKPDIIEEHLNHASEIWAPMIRHGEHPKRWHLEIDEGLQKFRAQFSGVEDFNTLPTWLDRATKIKDCCCFKLPGRHLCMRETKWTTPVLKKLHEELCDLRKPVAHGGPLLQRIERPPSECMTPEVDQISDRNERYYQAMNKIQAVIKGRAAQMHIYEGRQRCKELIQELKYSTGLLDEENKSIYDFKLAIKLKQRDRQIEQEKMSRLKENLDKLQGSVVGSLLDFLNKELRRLLEERSAHAMCLCLERERYDREAAEAGRRQVELRRRREHDEMFKQVVKIQQETVDLYLQDIIREGMDFASKEEADVYIKSLAQKIDDEAYKRVELVRNEDNLVADLVHHFVLPEVERHLVRERIQNKQRENLRTIHDAVYAKIESVEAAENSQIDDSSDDTED